jgi:gamma-glutamyltranspeptidase/glutathione hydrolase
VLVDGVPTREAIASPRIHIADDVVHAEAGYPEDGLAALADDGYRVNRFDQLSHFFGAVSAVGVGGAAGDPRRGGAGLLV